MIYGAFDSSAKLCLQRWPLHSTRLVCRTQIPKGSQVRKTVVTTPWITRVYFGFPNTIHRIHHLQYQQFISADYQQDRLKLRVEYDGKLSSSVANSRSLVRNFNKLPAHLSLKRLSNTKATICNEGLCQLYNQK